MDSFGFDHSVNSAATKFEQNGGRFSRNHLSGTKRTEYLFARFRLTDDKTSLCFDQNVRLAYDFHLISAKLKIIAACLGERYDKLT